MNLSNENACLFFRACRAGGSAGKKRKGVRNQDTREGGYDEDTQQDEGQTAEGRSGIALCQGASIRPVLPH